MAALVTTENFEFPEPSTYDATTSTIVDSARNTAGYVVGSVVREDVAKVEMTWRYLPANKWAEILSLFKNGNFYRNVTFYDQSTASYVTRLMYVSDRTAGMWRRHPNTGDIMGWTNCRIALVEV